jgi:hypothetical protein
MLNDEQKVQKLVDLLNKVIFRLEMAQFDIENAEKSHKVECDADSYYHEMISILH